MWGPTFDAQIDVGPNDMMVTRSLVIRMATIHTGGEDKLGGKTSYAFGLTAISITGTRNRPWLDTTPSQPAEEKVRQVPKGQLVHEWHNQRSR